MQWYVTSVIINKHGVPNEDTSINDNSCNSISDLAYGTLIPDGT